MRALAKCLFAGGMLVVVAAAVKASLDPQEIPKPKLVLLCSQRIVPGPGGIDYPICIGSCPNVGESCNQYIDPATLNLACGCS
jgi:hypothetical protein